MFACQIAEAPISISIYNFQASTSTPTINSWRLSFHLGGTLGSSHSHRPFFLAHFFLPALRVRLSYPRRSATATMAPALPIKFQELVQVCPTWLQRELQELTALLVDQRWCWGMFWRFHERCCQHKSSWRKELTESHNIACFYRIQLMCQYYFTLRSSI